MCQLIRFIMVQRYIKRANWYNTTYIIAEELIGKTKMILQCSFTEYYKLI